jgi:hypothetical protein
MHRDQFQANCDRLIGSGQISIVAAIDRMA